MKEEFYINGKIYCCIQNTRSTEPCRLIAGNDPNLIRGDTFELVERLYGQGMYLIFRKKCRVIKVSPNYDIEFVII